MPTLRTRNGCGSLCRNGLRTWPVLVHCSHRDYGRRRKISAAYLNNNCWHRSRDLRCSCLQQALRIVPIFPNTRAGSFRIAPDVGRGHSRVPHCAGGRRNFVALNETFRFRFRTPSASALGPGRSMVFSRQRWSSHNRRKRPITPTVETVGCGSMNLLQ